MFQLRILNVDSSEVQKIFSNNTVLAEKWILFNNAESKPKIIAKKENFYIDVIDRKLFEGIIKKVGVKL